MRELTLSEIELFDFTGRVPDLHVGGQSVQKTAAVQSIQRRPLVSIAKNAPKFRLGTTRPA